MDNLQNYLNGEYKKEKEQFREVEVLIQKSLSIFDLFQENSGWPYELEVLPEQNPSDKGTQKLSSSTTAMLAFAMSVLMGGKFDLALKSEDTCTNYFAEKMQLSTVYKQSRKLLCDNFLKSEVVKGKQVKPENAFASGTYGINDPFTLMWVRHISKDDKVDDKENNWTSFEDVCKKRIQEVFKTIYSSRNNLEYSSGKQGKSPIENTHIFPLLKIVQLYTTFENLDIKQGSHDIKQFAIDAVKDMLRNRLHYHLSLSCIDNSNFDAAELVFALEGLLLLDDNKQNFDDSLLDSVFRVITDRQNISLYWRPLKPFVCNEKGLALLPLSVEIAMSLIRICRLLGKNGEKLFSKNYEVFNKYTQWLKTRIVIVNQKDDIKHYGWCSEHIDQPNKIHLWETSQVLVYLVNFNDMLQKNIAYKSLTYSNLSWKPYPPEQIKLSGFLAKLISKDLIKNDKISDAIKIVNENSTLAETDYTKALEDCISDSDCAERLLSAYCVNLNKKEKDMQLYKWETEEPVQYLEVYQDICNNYIVNDNGGDTWSMLLFGPPGTGKTFIAEQIARVRGWPLITITPSDFIASGADQVETKAKNIFTVLMEQKDVVVLFDEIDRLIMDRDAPLYFEQGDMFQFMTPSMLVKIKDLRTQAEKSKIIFIICTNYSERIDPAIKRAGRIDKRYLVLPPDIKRRKTIIAELLAKRLIKENKYVKNFKEIVEMIAKQTPYYSYTEIDQLFKDFYKKYKADKDRVDIDSLEALLNSVIEPSTISLLNYSEKLGIHKEEKTVQKPIDEFFSLLLLKAEIEAMNEQNNQNKIFLAREKRLVVDLLESEYQKDKLIAFKENLGTTFKKNEKENNNVKQSLVRILLGEIAETQDSNRKGVLTQIREVL